MSAGRNAGAHPGRNNGGGNAPASAGYPHHGTDMTDPSHPSSAAGPDNGGDGSGRGDAGMSMGSMAGALPPLQSQAVPIAQSVQRVSTATLPGMGSSQQLHMLPFGAQSSPAAQSQPFIQSYPHPQQPFLQQPGYYMQPGAAHGTNSFHGQTYPSGPYYGGQPPQQQQPPYMYYPQGYGQMSPSQAYPGSMQSPLGMSNSSVLPENPNMVPYGNPGPGPGRRTAGASGAMPGASPSKNAIPSAPRGPPRKPKQSGHALWVGNLPPGAQVHELKDHFARDATRDIESVFLISKSNCAFVNYRTEAACAAAMTRFHDSRFKGVRLVCRYRSSVTASVSSPPTGTNPLSPSPQQSQTAVEAIQQNREDSSKAEESMRQLEGGNKINDKYFIVKSLTVEDLELSARNGIWATQAHNEDALNKAFESVENVYLVFSANKSGEYFGYARMVSPINEEWASKLEWKPHVEVTTDDANLPRSIPTPATETAPRGRVIDDSARGTIFWEVESSGSEEDEEKEEPPEKEDPDTFGEDPTGPQTFGRPFKVEWISTARLPFYRTRGLRNPWNANRDVKIARDGTELETSVGRRLVQMFHRTAAPGGPAVLSPGSPQMTGGSMGYPAMPPY